MSRFLVALLLWWLPAVAQDAYPSRPVKFVVPFDPVWDDAPQLRQAIAADLMRWGQLARVAKIEAPQ